MLDLLPGLEDLLRGDRLLWANLVGELTRPGLICSYQHLDVKVILVRKGVSLVHVTGLGVEHLWISGIDNIPNDCRVLVHLDLIWIESWSPIVSVQVLLPVFPALDAVLLGHLVESFKHLGRLLLINLRKLLYFHEVDPFERTTRRRSLLKYLHLRQQGISRQTFLVLLDCDTFGPLRHAPAHL